MSKDDYPTKNDELRKDSLQQYNSSTPVDRARDHHSITELVAERKERQEVVREVYTLVQKQDEHFLHTS